MELGAVIMTAMMALRVSPPVEVYGTVNLPMSPGLLFLAAVTM